MSPRAFYYKVDVCNVYVYLNISMRHTMTAGQWQRDRNKVIINLLLLKLAHWAGLDVPSKHSSSGSRLRWMETSLKYSLKETEKPNRSADTFLMSILAWSSLTLSPRHRRTFCDSLKFKMPSLSWSYSWVGQTMRTVKYFYWKYIQGVRCPPKKRVT